MSCLYSLGNDMKAELSGNPDDRLDDDPLGSALRQPFHKTAIDLDFCEGEILKIAQICVTSTEIVDRQADAKLAQVSHDRQRFRGTLDHQALGEFKLDRCGIGAAGRQYTGDKFRHIAKLELDRRNIEGEDYRHVSIPVHSHGKVSDGAKPAGANVKYETRVFGMADELVGRLNPK
jgi:hypothetical protein